MRVLLLNQYYHPDVAATAQLAADLGESLARRGHRVTAVASARFYAGPGRLPLVDDHRGVRILRVPATALAPVLAVERPDVVVALSTPPLVAALGLAARWLRGARLVFWVMDVYPEVALELGALPRDGAAARLLARASRLVLDRADAVVALDEAMRERLVASGADPRKVAVIDNWCDGDAIRPAPIGGNALRAQLGWDGAFTVSYSGNMGHGHDLATVARAMELTAAEDLRWLFIGDGPRRAELERAARPLGQKAAFLPYRPRDELPVSLTAAHASLVSLEPQLAGLLVPSKLYALLAAGVPVLYVGPSEGRVATVVREHGVGLAVKNGDARGLADAVERLRGDPAERAAMGRRGRALFEERFARRLALERHHDLLCRVAAC
jgi:glycosyltransferase involved in cell wall biosynthesis